MQEKKKREKSLSGDDENRMNEQEGIMKKYKLISWGIKSISINYY